MRQTFDFEFTEGYWTRSFRLTTDVSGYFVESYVEDSVQCFNNGVEYAFKDEEDRDGVIDMLCWAFETREYRKDPRDVLVEVK